MNDTTAKSARLRLGANIALAAACLGLAPLAKKAALTGGAKPFSLAIVATAVATVLALILLAVRGERAVIVRHPARTYLHVALIGVMGTGAVTLLAILAMTETTATNRSLFQSMYPVATAIAARFMLRERPGRGAYWLIALMCVGLYLTNSGGSWRLETGAAFWMLVATLPLIGLSDVYAKKTLSDARPEFVGAGRYLFGMIALLVTLPFTALGDWHALLAVWWWVLVAGATMVGGVYGLYRAMETAGASLAAAYIALAPVVTALAEWALLDATFGIWQVVGIGIVVGGAGALAYRG